MNFLTLKWFNYPFIIDDFICSSISMRSYKVMVSVFWDLKLGTLALTSLEFRKLYAKTRSGSKTWWSYSPTMYNALSLPIN
jgi:hypothetical protein